jgi:DNA polymerase IV
MSATHWTASSPPLHLAAESKRPTLDLSLLPPVFVSVTHLDTCELHELEDNLAQCGAPLTYNLKEAKIVLTKAERKRRIQLDLRTNGCPTEEVEVVRLADSLHNTSPDVTLESEAKRDKIAQENHSSSKTSFTADINCSTDSETEDEGTLEAGHSKLKRKHSSASLDPNQGYFSSPYVKVLKIQWLEDCQNRGIILPIEPYLLYQGRRIREQTDIKTPVKSTSTSNHFSTPQSIMERARADGVANNSSPAQQHGQRRLGQIGGNRKSAPFQPSSHTKHAQLLHQTTSEHDLGQSSDMPEMPQWVRDDVKYACQRSTPPNPPNASFIAQLEKIKFARLLGGDEIGVRAYSTSIASLAAYPHPLSSPREILLLPGCDAKIANLYVEYANYGVIKEVQEVESNPELKVQKLFYNIWGCGATTAKEFYHEKGWRDMDDVIEYGWATLTRVQQIGVKFYDEFLLRIPRKEVEDIASIIHRHAVKLRGDEVQSLVVGGYRRGKKDCGDVDIIISHPDESKTLNIITEIVASLEEEGHITHTLLISTTTSSRGQQTLPLNNTSTHGHGFDSLDKALVVWQKPMSHGSQSLGTKNTNPHRRVDMIISPWKTVGCAVMGWSSGTTFQRDLRRYVRQTYDYKFDSSGVRDRRTGRVVDVDQFEKETTRADTMVQAEKNVFKTLGLVWREPEERCTG